MKRFLLLLLIGCGCACTSIDNAPAPTQAGWVLFGYVNTAFGNHCEAAMRAAQLDEYRRQTTDEGRREVQDRYFLRERIVNDGNVWRDTHGSSNSGSGNISARREPNCMLPVKLYMATNPKRRP